MVKNTQKQKKNTDFVRKVQKRNGTIVPFNLEKIAVAINKAMIASGEGSEEEAHSLAHNVFMDLVKVAKLHKTFIPTIEGIQDSVETELILGDYVKTSKAYILYRKERAKLREQGIKVPEKVKKLTLEGKKYFRNPLAEFVYYRSYSKWIEKEGRRETWIETVDRYMDFMKENLGKKLKDAEYKRLREFILAQKSMPSMRLMWSAGLAARKTNVTGYNCSFIAPTKAKDFGEIMYISMCGGGVGFSVESHNVQKLPQITKQTGKKKVIHIVADSKEGWADAFVLALETWFNGEDIDFDYSKLRPKGAKLKTMGGKSSGPEPLIELMSFTKRKVLKRQGKRLSNLDVHDIVCKIGEIVVSGGVRRTALISLSDLDDREMRSAKFGQFYLAEPQRMMANNSAIYNEKPSNLEFLDEWVALMKSNSGERGIFNRGSLFSQMPKRRWSVFEKDLDSSGVNPCGEIILKSKEFCNLSEVVARLEDTEKTLLEKAEVAAILGTYQATLTNFGYLSKGWKANCEEERLLGVSVTGQWDCKILKNNPVLLQKLKNKVIKTNEIYAKRFGINQATATTCVKPSGTVSQLVDSSSGMHPRHSQYYIRRIRISSTDSLFKMIKDQGIPYYPEVGQNRETANTYVLEFPVKAPVKSVFKNDLTAIEQLEHWKMVKTNYTEHNPSVTISIGEDEWIETGNWVYKNWDIVGGLSFLPRSNAVYKMAPYEEIDKKTYEEMVKRFKDIDFSKIVTYEREDETEGSKELACTSGVCEL
ncbi:ribonucleoside-triphosphate reductase [Patescibacteria group bacterium]|nr:ribonucleoside-triphosphate reductase [Patescibacteria group bacterium]MCG2695153.1 ribonucleoside-triphosphate reductase [Candidatus Parcubacteria bacterium]